MRWSFGVDSLDGLLDGTATEMLGLWDETDYVGGALIENAIDRHLASGERLLVAHTGEDALLADRAIPLRAEGLLRRSRSSDLVFFEVSSGSTRALLQAIRRAVERYEVRRVVIDQVEWIVDWTVKGLESLVATCRDARVPLLLGSSPSGPPVEAVSILAGSTTGTKWPALADMHRILDAVVRIGSSSESERALCFPLATESRPGPIGRCNLAFDSGRYRCRSVSDSPRMPFTASR